ncbi:MAG: ABC transporter permease [Dehalococcoidia bacterium]
MREPVQSVAPPAFPVLVWTTVRRAASGVGHFTVHKPLGAIGLYISLFIILLGIFAPVIATDDPLFQTPMRRLEAPSFEHIFGTDQFGRDIYSRIVYGARVSLIVAFFAIGIGCTLGFVLGVISGYAGGWIDNVLQRITEVLLAFPTLILALLLVIVWGGGLDKVIIALAFVFTPRTLRTIRGHVLSVKVNDYVDAARVIGAGHIRIMAVHILPNSMAPYFIVASTLLGAAILTEATLSFLGLGVPPPHSSWGRMLAGGARDYGAIAPWMVMAPGAFITTLVLGFNLFGDALRDVLDPRLRGTQ